MATTIASYNVTLSLKAAGFVDQSKLSRAETQKLKSTLSSIETEAGRYEQALNSLNRAVRNGAITTEHYNRALEALNQKYKNLESSTVSLSSMRSMALSVGAAFASWKYIAEPLVKLAAQLESTRIQFEVLTDSVEITDKLISGMRKLAAASPLTSMAVQSAAKTLLAFGVTNESILPVLKQLADVSLGNEERFKTLALAFGQTAAAGRLMGQEVLQFVNAGFNPLQEISRKTGESMLELKKRMEDGKISAKEVADAFTSATSEGGKFAGMTDQLSQTIDGKLAQSLDKVQQSGARLGQTLAPLFVDMSKAFADTAEQAAGLNEKVTALEVTLNSYARAARFVVAAGKDLFSPTTMFGNPQNIKNLMEEIGREDQERMRVIRQSRLSKIEESNSMNKLKGEFNVLAEGNVGASVDVRHRLTQKAMQNQVTSEDYIAAIKELKEEIKKQNEIALSQLKLQALGNSRLELLKPTERVR